MIIAKNDEEKRSKIWRMVILVTSILIILIAVFLITKLFTANPLEGRWEDEDGRLTMEVRSDGTLLVDMSGIAEDATVDVKLNYTIDKGGKILTIDRDEEELAKLAEESEGAYTQETLENALDILTTTFNYSVDQQQLTLTEREYGDQMIFLKK